MPEPVEIEPIKAEAEPAVVEPVDARTVPAAVEPAAEPQKPVETGPPKPRGEPAVRQPESSEVEPVTAPLDPDAVPIFDGEDFDPESLQLTPVVATEGSLDVFIIGDSISSGLSPTDASNAGVDPRVSYRPGLYSEIDADTDITADVDFVGWWTYNASTLPSDFDNHSSFRGWATSTFISNPARWSSIGGDIALVLLGANDTIGNRPDASFERDLRDILTGIRATNPNIHILLGTITPHDRANSGKVDDFNLIIEDQVNADGAASWPGSTATSPITIVDHHDGHGGNPAFDVATHTVDDLHPNPLGEALLAANWWSALGPLLLPPEVTLEAPSSVFTSAIYPAPGSGSQTDTAMVWEGLDSFDLEVTRDGLVSTPLTVNYTVSGTATNGSDFSTLTGSIVIPAGSKTADISIAITDDMVAESAETLNISLSTHANYTLGSATTANMQILDNDQSSSTSLAVLAAAAADSQAVELPSVSIAAVGGDIVESSSGVAQFMVSRSGDLSRDLVVDIALSGTATAGEDYIAPSRSVVIEAGNESAYVDVALLDDDDWETSETLIAEIEASRRYDIGQSSDLIDITDDDDQNTIASFLSQFMFAIPNGASNLAFRVSN